MHFRKFNDIINIIFCLIACLFLFIYPKSCIEAAKDGVTTALYIVLPSIFPFMVLAKFIISTNIYYPISKLIGTPFEVLFGINKNYSAVFLLGCIGGYPIGAITINELLKKGEISVKDAEYLIGFCNNSGPMFIIGTVGTLMLNNTFYGYILYIIHIFSVVLCGIIMRFIFRPTVKPAVTCNIRQKNNSYFSNSITGSASAMINIASYIIVFSVIARFITISFNNQSLFTLLPLCVLEVTTGVNYTALSSINEILKISLISSAVGFSGLCVLSQSKAVFENIRISFSKYILSKLIIALLSFIIAGIVFTIIFSH